MINDHFSAFQDMKDFGAFWGMRKIKHEAHKLSFWKYLTINKTCPCQFPETQSASFLLSTLNSFRGCWRSATAVACDVILAEVDGKHPWQVPICGGQAEHLLLIWMSVLSYLPGESFSLFRMSTLTVRLFFYLPVPGRIYLPLFCAPSITWREF